MTDSYYRYLNGVFCVAFVIMGPSFGRARLPIVNATTRQASGSPLVFKTDTLESKVCPQDRLTVAASLTNTGSEAIAIDTVGLRYQFVVRTVKRLPSGGSVQVMTKSGDYGPGQYNDSTYRVLKAGEKYSTTLDIPLTDKFFSGKGSYKIQFTYGQFRGEYSYQGVKLFKGTAESNEVDFGVVSCSPKAAMKVLPDYK